MAFKITPELKRVYHLNYTAKPDNRMKLAVRAQCAHAIKSGKLTRLPCEKCGEAKSEAHHEDYSKPLDVKWLCHQCHAAVHRKTHCSRGHSMAENGFRGSDRRQCRQCKHENTKKHRHRKRLERESEATTA